MSGGPEWEFVEQPLLVHLASLGLADSELVRGPSRATGLVGRRIGRCCWRSGSVIA